MKHDWPTEAEVRLRAYLCSRLIPAGLGAMDAASSMAAINFAIDGRATESTPVCMSDVIGRWLTWAQDTMPAAMRNSPEWSDLLPLATATGRNHERERLGVLLDWLWETVMPSLQHAADDAAFGEAWQTMCSQRTAASARAAARAAQAPAIARDEIHIYAFTAADAAATAVTFRNAPTASERLNDPGEAAEHAGRAAGLVAAAHMALDAETWRTFDQAGLLRRMIEIQCPYEMPAWDELPERLRNTLVALNDGEPVKWSIPTA